VPGWTVETVSEEKRKISDPEQKKEVFFAHSTCSLPNAYLSHSSTLMGDVRSNSILHFINIYSSTTPSTHN
jgi:hypothetical protein